MIITSVQNQLVKELKKMMRDKSLLFFDNPKLIAEAKNAGHEILYIIKSETYNGKTDYGGTLVEVSQNVFNSFSSTENSQGLVGVVKLNQRALTAPSGNFLVMDEIQDPGNAGTLIRSALGANFLDIYMLSSVKLTNEKLVRASMGAIFKTRIYETTKDEFLTQFKKWNKNLYVCDMNGKNIYNETFSYGTGIVVGNEGNGVSNELRAIANQSIKIPMLNGLESLNAGVSGSIIMYQIQNKN